MSVCGDTFLYCRPGVLESTAGELHVDAVLHALACELGCEDSPTFREGRGGSIVVPGFEPREVWAALERVTDHSERWALFVPRGG